MNAHAGQGSLRALLWDVDGTLAETERDGHRVAFNRAFAEHGLPWRWDPDTYLGLLRITGGRERLRWFLSHHDGTEPPGALLDALHRSKQRHYRELVEAGEVHLRPGVRRLIAAAAAAGLRQAIVTTSGREAVTALLASQLRDLSELLTVRICGEDVRSKKPHPEAYGLALQVLNLAPAQAVAIEDSGPGLAAATGAGLRCLVSLSAASSKEDPTTFAAAAALVDGLGEAGTPASVIQGPACAGGLVTLSYLEELTPP